MANQKKARRAWSKKEDKVLAKMTSKGKSNEEIAEVLGRTPGAVAFRKSKFGVKTKTVRTKDGQPITIQAGPMVTDAPVVSTRDQAKEMARAARHIARANGKRITMAMFFVENL